MKCLFRISRRQLSDYYSIYKNSYEDHAAKFSHIDEKTGQAKMVDVGEKQVTKRSAKAKASVFVGYEVFALIKGAFINHGDNKREN